ncbi:MAG: sulfatase family protein [Planctomycetaceae bacterium]
MRTTPSTDVWQRHQCVQRRWSAARFVMVCWLTIVAAEVGWAAEEDGAASRPNVVVILADDMGYGDPQCYNADSKIPTPHLDQLAENGLLFTDAHTPSSVCTPTRYGLLTGRYCWRTRLTKGVLDGFSPPLIDADRPTIASFLKSQGYATACVGKWHLGMQWTRQDGSPETLDREARVHRGGENIDCTVPVTGGPLAVGFDSYFGISASLDMAPLAWMENDRCVPFPDLIYPDARKEMFLTHSPGVGHSEFRLDEVLPTLKQRTIAWIDTNCAEQPGQPFFLYLPLNSPHLPVAPSQAFLGKSQAGLYGDFVVETDDFVGGVVATLKQQGQLENTVLVFTSDNGGLWHMWTAQEADDVASYKPTPRAQYADGFGHHSNGTLRGTKADVYEGGHRVPLLMQWPRVITASRRVDTPVELTDLFATIADVIGQALPDAAAPDSFSFAAELGLSRRSSLQRTTLVHHSLQGVFSIREAGWKYAEARGSGGFSVPRTVAARPGEATGQLYHLETDPQETRNLFLSEPERVVAMQRRLDSIRSSAGMRY